MRTKHQLYFKEIVIPGGEGSTAHPTAFVGPSAIPKKMRETPHVSFKVMQKNERAGGVLRAGMHVFLQLNPLPRVNGAWAGEGAAPKPELAPAPLKLKPRIVIITRNE
jgi:hypothetical protein